MASCSRSWRASFYTNRLAALQNYFLSLELLKNLCFGWIWNIQQYFLNSSIQLIAGSGNSKATKGKKKNRRRKEQNKDSNTADAYQTERKVIIQWSFKCRGELFSPYEFVNDYEVSLLIKPKYEVRPYLMGSNVTLLGHSFLFDSLI